ncbi:efflux RND transporter permease subunit [candidate division KSB1 bacterium]
MNRAIAWFAENRVAANLLMFLILAAGFFSITQVKMEVFPEFSADMITVSVAYLGAAPEEVEEGVCVRIEEAVQDLEGIKKLTSTASEGVGSVTIEVEPDYDSRKLLDDIKSRVDAISTFPVETEKPVIQEIVTRRQVISIAVSGETNEKSLKSIAEQIRDELTDLPEISQVELAGARPYEISIEVSENQLRRFGLTFDEVAQAVRLSSLDLPGGSIKSNTGEYAIRTNAQAYKGLEFEKITLRSLPDGTRLTLGDVAEVVDGFADTDQVSRFDSEPVVLVQVFRVGDENVLTVADAVKEYIGKKQQQMPDGIHITTWKDDSLVFKDRLFLLLRNGRMGFALVFLALAFFLRLRLAWWVTVGMIVSFFGAFWTMPINDVSLNMISMFAFILVLGIVVDDAIVIGENIYSHVERGKSSLRAAIDGTREVAVPVTFAVLTTVAAFSPLLAVEGFMGKIMAVVPLIVIACLLFSLVESLFILPAHLSHTKVKGSNNHRNGLYRKWNDFQKSLIDKFQLIVNRYYKNTLDFTLRWRYLTLSIGIGILLLSVSIVAGGRLGFVFMPDIESDNVLARLTMPQGTPVEITSQAVKRLEEGAQLLKMEYESNGNNPIVNILSSIGEQPSRDERGPAHGTLGSTSSSNIGEVNIQLIPGDLRTVNSEVLAVRWREIVGNISGAEELTFTSSLFSVGEPINIQLSGADYELLQSAANDLKDIFAGYAGVFDISDSYREGKKELQLQLKEDAKALGLTQTNLAFQVRQAFYGEEAQRIQRGRDDIRVMIRYPEEYRRSIGDLENMRIRVPGGVEVPFSVTADIVEGIGFASISRTDRKRAINITADVDVSIANSNEIILDMTANVLPGFLEDHPGISYTLEGEQYEQQKAFAGLGQGFLFALLVIYILLAIPFRSYMQPFIVMSAIPFGFIGAILGHIFMGMDLTIISGFGIVALTGVVVNDSLVLVDFINRRRAEGKELMEAIILAGVARFRPIMLTSLTTFAGLSPLLFEKSMQAQFLIPMAVSLAFGVLFATLITLVLVPAIYFILEDFIGLVKRTVVE